MVRPAWIGRKRRGEGGKKEEQGESNSFVGFFFLYNSVSFSSEFYHLEENGRYSNNWYFSFCPTNTSCLNMPDFLIHQAKWFDTSIMHGISLSGVNHLYSKCRFLRSRLSQLLLSLALIEKQQCFLWQVDLLLKFIV